MARKRRRKKSRYRKFSKHWKLILAVLVVFWIVMEGRFCIPKFVRPPKDIQPIEVKMKTTSYCHCRRCCSYKWFLIIPFQKTGTFSFRIKHIGVTSSGAKVGPGTIAADPSIYPYGTIMHIPGYGYGVVEDTGGAIKGQHIDLYRPNHWFAKGWGVREKTVKIWLPEKPVEIPDEELAEDFGNMIAE